MTSKTINPAMIIPVQESRGWLQAELAKKSGFSLANLSKIEKAEIGIQQDTVCGIADAAGYPWQFFTQSDIRPPNLNYRKLVNVVQKIITSVKTQV